MSEFFSYFFSYIFHLGWIAIIYFHNIFTRSEQRPRSVFLNLLIMFSECLLENIYSYCLWNTFHSCQLLRMINGYCDVKHLLNSSKTRGQYTWLSLKAAALDFLVQNVQLIVTVVSGWGKLKFQIWPEKAWNYYHCKHVNDYRYIVTTGEKKIEEKWKSASEEWLGVKMSIFEIISIIK